MGEIETKWGYQNLSRVKNKVMLVFPTSVNRNIGLEGAFWTTVSSLMCVEASINPRNTHNCHLKPLH